MIYLKTELKTLVHDIFIHILNRYMSMNNTDYNFSHGAYDLLFEYKYTRIGEDIKIKQILYI